MKNYKRMYEEQKQKNQHYEELCNSAVGELRFELLQVEALKNVLDEITVISTDQLAKKIVDMAKERHEVDKMIHTRNLFSKK